MSNQAIESIMQQLKEVFAPHDENLVNKTKTWASERHAALFAYIETDEYKSDIRHNNSRAYANRFAISGGKTWHEIIYGRTIKDRNQIIEKRCASIQKKRDESIASKLIKAGVTEVTGTKFVHTNDGFNGYFHVTTDKGIKLVEIETIFAGGYNIQCAHNRTMVKIK